MNDLEDRLRRAITRDGRHLQRLGSAGISVTFCVDGAEHVTLLLDRYPPEVATDHGDVTIDLDRAQAEALAKGELVLANSFMKGEVAYAGDVRRYLAVDPILRGLLTTIDEGAS